MVKLVNRAKVTTPTIGTGTLTLGPAVDGFQSFADAGVLTGDVVRYVIEDGDTWEIGTGTFHGTTNTLTRIPSQSSARGKPITLTGSAQVFVTACTEDLDALKPQPGDLRIAPSGRTIEGFLECNGATYNPATYPNLATLGLTANLPAPEIEIAPYGKLILPLALSETETFYYWDADNDGASNSGDIRSTDNPLFNDAFYGVIDPSFSAYLNTPSGFVELFIASQADIEAIYRRYGTIHPEWRNWWYMSATAGNSGYMSSVLYKDAPSTFISRSSTYTQHVLFRLPSPPTQPVNVLPSLSVTAGALGPGNAYSFYIRY